MILYVVLASLPLLAVCLLYSLLEHDSTFNIVDGNATAQLCMAISKDFAVTFSFVVADFMAPALDRLVNGAGGNSMNSYNGQKGVA